MPRVKRRLSNLSSKSYFLSRVMLSCVKRLAKSARRRVARRRALFPDSDRKGTGVLPRSSQCGRQGRGDAFGLIRTDYVRAPPLPPPPPSSVTTPLFESQARPVRPFAAFHIFDELNAGTSTPGFAVVETTKAGVGPAAVVGAFRPCIIARPLFPWRNFADVAVNPPGAPAPGIKESLFILSPLIPKLRSYLTEAEA